jgi:hypothetical protein
VVPTGRANTLRETLLDRSAVRAIVVGCLLWVCASATPYAGLLDEAQVGDTPEYGRYGDAMLAGEVPYRDFYVEYPPGALPVFAAPAVGPSDGYAWRFKLLMLALGLVLVGAVVATLARAGSDPRRLLAAAALVGIAPAALGPVVLVNYDVWPALLATGAVAALAFRRSATSGALLALAFAAKVFPLVLLPLALLHLRARLGRSAALRCLAAFAAVSTAIVGPFAVIAPGAIGFDVTVALRRPLQIESLGSSLLLAAHRLGLYTAQVDSESNSQNLGGHVAAAFASIGSLVAVAVVVGIVLLYRRRAGDLSALVVASAAAVSALVAFGKVLSPQYVVWLVPLVALTGSWSAYALVFAALLLTHVWFPSRYGDLVGLGDIAWVVLARNVVLVALTVVLMRALRRPEGA